MKKKRFRFRLERILKFRTSERTELERALAEENRKLQEREARRIEIEEAQAAAQGPASGVLTMAELAALGDYRRSLQEALVWQRVLVREAIEAVDAARERYLEKSKEVKTLESLKDKKLEEYKEERKQTEKKTLDEITVQRSGRRL